MKNYIIFGLLLLGSLKSYGQNILQGTVTDSISGEPIPYAQVYAKLSKEIALTDTAGFFHIELINEQDTLVVREISYKQKAISVYSGNHIQIHLQENMVDFEEVVVRAGENPAYAILDKIEQNKPQNDPYRFKAYECKVYSKTQFNLDNLSEKFENRKALQKMDFILDYVDTADGNNTLPVLFAETTSRMYSKTNPSKQKEIITASRVVGMEQLDLTKYLGELSQRINIYQQNVVILGRDFMSPIAKGGRGFYKYYLQEKDTLNGQTCYHIKFKPRYKGTAVFIGDMWIDDSTYAVSKVMLEKPDGINVNYLQKFDFEQNFEKLNDSTYLPMNDRLEATFNLLNSSDTSRLAGVKVIKNVQRDEFVINAPKPASFYKERLIIEDGADERDAEFWESERPMDLSQGEEGISIMIDSLKQNRHFQRLDKLATFAFTGFWKAGPIEIGNLYSAYNKNVVEGHRVRLTLRSSKAFSKNVRITAYGAYGFKDKKFKYGTSLRWKLNNSNYEVLELGYKKDIDQLALGNTQFDFGRSLAMLMANRPVDKLNMVHRAQVNYTRDWDVNLRTKVGASWTQLTPMGNLKYTLRPVDGVQGKSLNSVSAFESSYSVIFTKEEKFINGSNRRISLGSKYPVIGLTHTIGAYRLDKQYRMYNKSDVSVRQTIRLGVAGKIRYRLYAGKVFQSAPLPFLEIHRGSESYYLQKEGFNLMQYYEFISDEWVGFNFEHQLQGLIMDRIPLINRLKIRTVYGVKAVLGNYAKRNQGPIMLPSFSQSLGGKPYAEVSVGIENLFKFIRVDAVWRVTHRNQTGLGGVPAPNFGVRVMFATAL